MSGSASRCVRCYVGNFALIVFEQHCAAQGAQMGHAVLVQQWMRARPVTVDDERAEFIGLELN